MPRSRHRKPGWHTRAAAAATTTAATTQVAPALACRPFCGYTRIHDDPMMLFRHRRACNWRDWPPTALSQPLLLLLLPHLGHHSIAVSGSGPTLFEQRLRCWCCYRLRYYAAPSARGHGLSATPMLLSACCCFADAAPARLPAWLQKQRHALCDMGLLLLGAHAAQPAALEQCWCHPLGCLVCVCTCADDRQ